MAGCTACGARAARSGGSQQIFFTVRGLSALEWGEDHDDDMDATTRSRLPSRHVKFADGVGLALESHLSGEEAIGS